MSTLDLEVFRAGDYGDRGSWDEPSLDRIAQSYSPSLHEAPVTVDHAQSGPALGWVESLRRVGSVLVARLRDLDAGFESMIRRGAFKKRSVELYPSLKETEGPYLRAVSFLGACPPAVKGLADVVFAESESEPVQVEFAEMESADDTDDRWTALREGLMASGRWLPRWEENGLREFWGGLDSADQREWFTRFLDSLPPVVPTERLGATPTPVVKFDEGVPASSARAEVSSSSVTLHRRVLALREEHPEMNYSEALRAVARCV